MHGCLQNVKKYPQLAEIAARVPKNTVLTKEAFLKHLEELDKSLRSVPATAQVTSHIRVMLRCREEIVQGHSSDLVVSR